MEEPRHPAHLKKKNSLNLEKFQNCLHRREKQDYLVHIQNNAQKKLQTWLEFSSKHRRPGVSG